MKGFRCARCGVFVPVEKKIARVKFPARDNPSLVSEDRKTDDLCEACYKEYEEWRDSYINWRDKRREE